MLSSVIFSGHLVSDGLRPSESERVKVRRSVAEREYLRVSAQFERRTSNVQPRILKFWGIPGVLPANRHEGFAKRGF